MCVKKWAAHYHAWTSFYFLYIYFFQIENCFKVNIIFILKVCTYNGTFYIYTAYIIIFCPSNHWEAVQLMLILFTNCLTVFRFIAPKCIPSFWPCWSINVSAIKDECTDNLMSTYDCRGETRAPSGAAEHRTQHSCNAQIKEG